MAEETPREVYERQCREVSEELVSRQTLRFVARDLGFPDHTEIHKAACRIIAAGIAPLIVAERTP